MRKFIFSSTIVSALMHGVKTAQATRKGPRDWRLILMWLIWGLTMTIAVGTVIENAEAENELEE